MLKYLPEVALFGASILSLVNILAGAFGLGPALTWATGLPFWMSITTPLAFVGIGFLIYSWINSLMSNFSGMAIYFLNILLAPFGYALLGLPYPLGLALALAPLPFYSGMRWLSERLGSHA
ncbi:MAG: hypothetical protein WBA82_15115 [Castellaniella sp.]